MSRSQDSPHGLSRRSFLKKSGQIALNAGVYSAFARVIRIGDAIAAIPVAGGYLLVDTKKCQGCNTCMLACSLAHEGSENLSLARIQVIQNPFQKFPDDLTIAQCRQCVEPACVEACPEEALFVDSANGNVRRIDKEKCTGCQACIEACPYTPSRIVWSREEELAQKCDLCAETPFWQQKGGPDGKQVCVEVCPMKAIQFTTDIPVQEGTAGYQVNLRGTEWASTMKYSTK